jgi:hypothetical protein
LAAPKVAPPRSAGFTNIDIEILPDAVFIYGHTLAEHAHAELSPCPSAGWAGAILSAIEQFSCADAPRHQRGIDIISVKVAIILDQAQGTFGLEYDDTRGKKHTMRLDAQTYDGALREAKSFLGIQKDDRDEAGDQWTIC